MCGPPKYSEIRINVAQAFNGIGTVVAPVLASYVFFTNVGTDQKALENVQWTYLGIACFVFLLAVVYYFTDIPEITGRLSACGWVCLSRSLTWIRCRHGVPG